MHQSPRQPRTSQKNRTRDAMLEGARQLMAKGEPVSVAAAAALMGISRATAYRYFADPQALAVEAGLDIKVLPYETVVEGAPDLRGRLAVIAAYMLRLTLENEESFRAFIAQSATAAGTGTGPRRGARRVAYFRRALEEGGHTLPEEQVNRLLAQLSAATGIEVLISFADIARLPGDQIPDTAAEMVEAILERHLGPAGH